MTRIPQNIPCREARNSALTILGIETLEFQLPHEFRELQLLGAILVLNLQELKATHELHVWFVGLLYSLLFVFGCTISTIITLLDLYIRYVYMIQCLSVETFIIYRTQFLFPPPISPQQWTGLAGCTWQNPLDAWATGAATPAAASMVVPRRNGAAKHGGWEGGAIVDSTVPTKNSCKEM